MEFESRAHEPSCSSSRPTSPADRIAISSLREEVVSLNELSERHRFDAESLRLRGDRTVSELAKTRSNGDACETNLSLCREKLATVTTDCNDCHEKLDKCRSDLLECNKRCQTLEHNLLPASKYDPYSTSRKSSPATPRVVRAPDCRRPGS